jgi:quinoprotein glucose dehydrogenase
MKGGSVAPSLLDVAQRHSREELATIIRQGTGRMPAFAEMLDGGAINDLVNFLVTGKDVAETATTNPNYLRFRNNGYPIFLDHEGYPGISPPWGTLNAIDLNRGEIAWKVPLGELPELVKRGRPKTGTENYGGPIVTAGGLVFIGATKDEKFRAFDKKTGQVLWETSLPAGGYATPSTYAVGGKQYVVIAAGGGKMGTKSGDSYVAFALPD